MRSCNIPVSFLYSQQCSEEIKRIQERKIKKSRIKPSAQRQDDCAPESTNTPKPKPAAARLPTPPTSRTKPVITKDDPRDRVQAFLTEVPFLE